MDAGLIKIDNKTFLIEDKKSKSQSFYLKNPYQKVDERMITFLNDFSNNNNNCDLRICIHENPNSVHHDMLILHHKNNYYPPHIHTDCGDTYIVYSGEMGCFLFDDSGSVTYSCIIGSKEMFKVPNNTYHTILPLSKKVIFYELRNGPFISGKKPKAPLWCPDLNAEESKINSYKKELLNIFA